MEFLKDSKNDRRPSTVAFGFSRGKLKDLNIRKGKKYYTIIPYWKNMLLKCVIYDIKQIGKYIEVKGNVYN